MKNHDIVHAETFEHGIVGVVRFDSSGSTESPRALDNVTTMTCWHRNYRLGDAHEKKNERYDSEEFKLNLIEEALGNRRFSNYAEHCINNDSDAWEAHANAIIAKHFEIQPLYLYDHSGISISTGKFACPWDSGQVGFVYVSIKKAAGEFIRNLTAEKLKLINPKDWDTPVEVWEYDDVMKANKIVGQQTLREHTQKCIDAEVSTYDDYLTGQIFELEVYDFSDALQSGSVEDDDLLDPELLDFDKASSLEYVGGRIGGEDYCVSEMQNIAKSCCAKAEAEIAEKQFWADRDVVTEVA